MGIDALQWLKECEASPKLLEDDSLWLPRRQYEQLVEEALRLSPVPDIGLRLGEMLGIGSHGLLGYGLLLCEDLAQATRLLNKYISTRSGFIKTAIEETSDSLNIQICSTFENQALHQAFCETVAVSLAKLFTVLAGQDRMAAVIKAVHFDFAKPDYIASFQHHLPTSLYFSAHDCVIGLEKQWLHHHFSQADEMALKQLTRQFEQQLKQISTDIPESWQHKVQAILKQEQHCVPALQDVAKLLFVTPRTLHRRLIAEGTSFRDLMVTHKKTQAEKYLSESAMTIQQVAWALGYDDVANFRRAFKTWFNLTPTQFRQQILDKATTP